MANLWQDLRYGARMLLRAPGFTVVVVAVLALGIGANSAIFSFVNAVLIRPLPYADPDRLYLVQELDSKGRSQGAPLSDIQTLSGHAGVFESLGCHHWENGTISGPQGAENVYGARVSESLFPTLGVVPAAGRGFRPDEFHPGAPGAVILSDRVWERRFARNPAVIGTQLMLNGRSVTVAGVMARDFFHSQNFEFWSPWQITAADTAKREPRATCVARLASGAHLERARSAAEAAFRGAAAEDFDKGWRIRLQPVHEQITAESRPRLLVLLGAVGFVLLIACLNVANLLLARGSERARELAIRAALGAGPFRAIRQMLTESLLLSFAGGVLGLALGWAGTSAVIYFFDQQRPMPRMNEARIDLTVVAFTFGLCLLTGIVFGLMPALQASRTDVIEALKSGTRAAGASVRMRLVRNSLIVVETALSVVLLIGAGLLLRSFERLVSADPGFQPDHVLTMRLPIPTGITERPKHLAHYGRLLEQVNSVPGLNSAGLVLPLPLSGFDANATFSVEGRPNPPGERVLVKLRAASAGYFRAMGLTLVHGRVFAETDTASAPLVAIVSETLAKRHFNGEQPVGKRISMSSEGKGPWMTVVGVVRDVKQLSLADDGAPEMYRPYEQFLFSPFATTLVIRTAGADPAAVAAAVQRQIRSVHPDQPINDVLPMPDVVWRSTAQPRFYTILLGIFAFIALAVAAAGLYGVLSYAVSQRVREIGIRVALGASRASVLRAVVGHAMKIVCAGMAAGIAAAWYLGRFLESQLYQVRPADLHTYAAVCIVLATVASLAAWLPARRAASVDPSIALRCD